MSLLLKIMPNEFTNASRNKRELSVVKELSHEVIVIAKGTKNRITEVDNFEVHERTTRPLGNYKPIVGINRVLTLFMWAHYARKLKPDVISGHDLTGLFIGWLSTLFLCKEKRPLLVYDSHEFQLGRNVGKKGTRLRKLRVYLMEKFLISRSIFCMMVSDSIADEVQRIYKLKDRPTVIRNIAPYWDIDEVVCEAKRKELNATLGISDSSCLIMYHGGITKGRGIKNLINAIRFTENTSVIILGYGEKDYIDKLEKLVANKDLGQRVFFHDAVPIQELWKYVGAADIGLGIIESICKSYYYSLPNKLFENIQSLTPIVGSNFPEIKKIIEGFGIGLCCEPHDVHSIADSINKLKNDNTLYKRCRDNLVVAKNILCWENEEEKLIDAYSNIFGLIENKSKPDITKTENTQ